jgi:hypothetical protein
METFDHTHRNDGGEHERCVACAPCVDDIRCRRLERAAATEEGDRVELRTVLPLPMNGSANGLPAAEPG